VVATRAEFGDEFADVVRECSDTDVVPKPPWCARKKAYIAHLADASPSAIRMSLADNLHNARAIPPRSRSSTATARSSRAIGSRPRENEADSDEDPHNLTNHSWSA
jgi:(p)ppGpp synthase/HD superfamily hydrolase